MKERLDTTFILEQDRSDLEDGLGLLEALLDGRLALVCLEDLSVGQRAVIGEQGVHPIAFAIVIDGLLIDVRLHAPERAGLAHISGVGTWSTGSGLPEVVLLVLGERR
ncbi:MAG: hypothetical protein ACREXK_09075 [Gammaproteobacteria bacterium]